MATVSGVWVWNTGPEQNYPLSQQVNFTSNNEQFTEIAWDTSGIEEVSYGLWYYSSSGHVACYNDYQGWYYGTVYRTIDFGTTPQTVSDTFYTYLTANATRQGQTLYNVDPLEVGQKFSGTKTIYFNTNVVPPKDVDDTSGQEFFFGFEDVVNQANFYIFDVKLICTLLTIMGGLPESEVPQEEVYLLSLINTELTFDGIYNPLYISHEFTVTQAIIDAIKKAYGGDGDWTPKTIPAGWQVQQVDWTMAGESTAGLSFGSNTSAEQVNTFASWSEFSETPPAGETTIDNLPDFLSEIADTIRAKKGTTGQINAQDFPSEIASIETGVDTSNATAVAGDILLGETAYARGEKLTGTIPTWSGAYEDISTDSVIGFTGLTNSSGALTWTDDIADLQSSSPYTTTTSGTYVSVTGALDSYFPYNQITEVEDGNGNTFIRFPKCYIKWTNDSSGNIDGFQVSNAQVDSDYFIPDCFLNPNSVDGTDSYLDYVDIGKYEGSGSASMVYSRSGYALLVSITRANFRAGCRSYGTSSNYYNGYQQLDIQTFTLYNFLCMLYYRTSNIQSVYAGRTSASSANNTGSTDGVTGLNGWNTSTTCVKMLGVENPYGNVQKWCDGIYFSNTTSYIHRYPTQYADSTVNGTFIGFYRPSSSGYILSLRNGTSASTQSAVYCSNIRGSASTYVGDYNYYSSGERILCVGGAWDNGAEAGLWDLGGSSRASTALAGFSGRLCRRPM